MILNDDRSRVAHLLRRAGLGASRTELDFYSKLGWRGAVDALMDYENVPESYEGLDEAMVDGKGQLRPQTLELWWVYRLLTTRRPLQERMTLFWHNHFATSASKVAAGRLMLDQNELFRKVALAGFKDILVEVSKDPAMLLWLDNNTNVKGKPNENYAREVMELFTMGIGNYTEKDVQEAARAFTGWTLRRTGGGKNKVRSAEFRFARFQHDSGEKTVLGETGNFDGTDIADILVKQPATAKYMCKKLWEHLAYPNPEPAVLNALVQTYNESNYSIRAVVKRILTSNSFYSDKAVRAIYKSPVDFVVAALRSTGAGSKVPSLVPDKKPDGTVESLMEPKSQSPATRRALLVVRAVAQSLKRQGQELFYPPSVKGWDGGSAWISSATMLERIKFADFLFNTGKQSAPQRKGAPVRPIPAQLRRYSLVSVDDVIGDRKFSSVADVVHEVLGVFDADLPTPKQKALVIALEKGGGIEALANPTSGNEAIGEIVKLVFASPEYQFC